LLFSCDREVVRRLHRKTVFWIEECVCFQVKFPKKPSPRKTELSLTDKVLGPEKASRELGFDIRPIKLKLGDQESVFNNGEWVPGNNMRNNTVLIL